MTARQHSSTTSDFPPASRRLSEISDFGQVPLPGCLDHLGPQCGLQDANLTIPLLADSRILVIGPPQCGQYPKVVLLPEGREPTPLGDNLLVLPLDGQSADDVNERLGAAVEIIDRRYLPQVLFLGTTCLPRPLDLDLAGLAARLQPTTRAALLPLPGPTFSEGHGLQAMGALLTALVELMVGQKVQPQTVNILGLRGRAGRDAELVRVLGANGCRVLNVLPASGGMVGLRRAPAAALNIVVDDAALGLARAMHERFGTPWVDVGFPLTPAATLSAYERINAHLGLQPGHSLYLMRDAARQQRDAVRQQAGGRTLAIADFPGGSLAAAIFYSDLNFAPVALLLSRFGERAEGQARRLLQQGVDPLVVCCRRFEHAVETLQLLRPDCYVGHGDAALVKGLGLAQFAPTLPRALWGFEAGQWAMEMTLAALEGGPDRSGNRKQTGA